MSCDFKAEVSKMAVLYQNGFIVFVASKLVLLAIVSINKSSKLPSLTMWDNSLQYYYKEFKWLEIMRPIGSLLSPPYSRLV